MSKKQITITKKPNTSNIILKSNQIEHVNHIQNIIKWNSFWIDASETGTGKTYATSYIAQKYGFELFIICPVAAYAVWTCISEEYNIPIAFISSYEGFRSVTGKQPKHGYLKRTDTIKQVTNRRGKTSDIKTTEFEQTKKLTDLFKSRKILIVLDECQKIKNTVAQSKAIKILILNIHSTTKVAALSATPFDKVEQILTFCKITGLMKDRLLFRGNKDAGLSELLEYGRKLTTKKQRGLFNELEAGYIFLNTAKQARSWIYRLFVNIIRPHIMSIMPRSEINVDKDVKNGFYKMNTDNYKKYSAALSDLEAVLRGDDSKWSFSNMNRNNGNFGAVTKALVKIQCSKINIAVRLAIKKLEEVPNSRVLIYADYNCVIDEIMSRLSYYNPVSLTGKLTGKKRTDVIKKFQSNETNRVLVANLIAGGVAVSLHDIDGNYPRFMYIMPGYRINELHQATGRIFRNGVKSHAIIRFIYGPHCQNSGCLETSMLSSLSRKGKVIQETVKEQKGVVFPNEYPSEIETTTF
jgi:hypothetical protein